MNRSLIILEGPDRVGKSTIARRFSNETGSCLFSQPNPNGPLGFLRDIVKYDISIDNFSRQLLHTVSHVWDLFSFPLHDSIIMDRSFISSLIYGNLIGLTEDQISIIRNIHTHTYNLILQKYNYNVYIIYFCPDSPFSQKDDSIYESSLIWDDIKKRYDEFFSSSNRIFDGREIILSFNPNSSLEDNYQKFSSLISPLFHLSKNS